MSKRTITSRESATKKASGTLNVPDPVVEEWKAMFMVAEHWTSDLDFFLDELNFFRKLLDRYLNILTDERIFETTRHLVNGLVQFEKKRKQLETEIKEHLGKLTNMFKNPSPEQSELAFNSHSKLEGLVTDFAKNFKSLKKEVFALSEDAMESDKAKHLLGS